MSDELKCPRCGANFDCIHVASNTSDRPQYECGRDGPHGVDTVPCLRRSLRANQAALCILAGACSKAADQLSTQAQELDRLKEDLTTWRVSLVVPDNADSHRPSHEKIDCPVVDIGHSDRVIVVECPSLLDENAKLKRAIEAMGKDELHLDTAETGPHIDKWEWLGARSTEWHGPFDAAWQAALAGLDELEKETI